ncbi:MAG: PAS domain S-box protein [Treponema sp.]|jgi:PAS domain S-box-containing protein|nr:PAS domain S-box protein [Treponema sp.]
MRDFYNRAIKKLDKLTAEQSREILFSAALEIDRFESVLDSIPNGILVCDEKHCLTMVNKYAQRLLPLNYSETGGVPLWKAVQDERVVEFFRETLLGGDRVLEREIDAEVQGINRLLSISVLPLVKNHRITGSLIFIEDITEKRGREARLRRAENLASLTTLAAGVAHEIKNPLGSISIHLQLMQKALTKKKKRPGTESRSSPDTALLEKYLGILNEEVDRLNHIVVDFLFAVRPMTLELREGKVNDIIRELIGFVGPELEETRIRCELELAEELPPALLDERYMKQALLNLVKNAQAAMAGGGILGIKTSEADNKVKISVSDTGEGISEANLSKIFEPYFTTKEKGTGLGLTLVFKIVREHQGEISVESKVGEGSSFTITLPAIQKERRLLSYEAADASVANNGVGGSAEEGAAGEGGKR